MAKGKILETVISISGTIDPSLQKAVSGVADSLDGIDMKALKTGATFAAMGTSAVGIFGKVTTAIGGAIVDLAKMGNEYKQVMNQMSAETGATGAELEEMGDIVKDVYAQGMGESMQDVANSLSTIRQVSGLTGEELEKSTSSAMLLTDTFGYEVDETARTASSLMKNFGLSVEEAYGLIATGAQNGADQNGDLLDTLNEYSAQYAALGLSADQFLGSLIAGTDQGVFSIDKVGDAVKEFNIRAKDGSDTTTAAFQQLGFDANAMAANFAAGGDTAQEAFFQVVDALNNMEDPLAKNQIGVALFGTQFEDLEAGALDVMANMQDAAYDTAGTLQQISDVKYDDLGSAFESIKRTAEVTLLPLASTVANVFQGIMPEIQAVMEQVLPIFTDGLNQAMPFIQEFLGMFAEGVSAVLPMISELAAMLMPMLLQLMQQLLPPLIQMLNTIMPPLMELAQALMPVISAIISAIVPPIARIVSAILPTLIKLINPLLHLLTPILEVISGIANVVSILVSFLWEIVDAVSGGVGWVIDKLAGVFGFGGGGGDSGSVEGYAAGGFTSGPSLAGEDPRYPREAVISFNPRYRRQNLSYWAEAGYQLGVRADTMPLLASSTGSSTVIYNVGGVTFAPQIPVTGDTDEDALIKKLRDLEPEFVDFVLEAIHRREAGAYVTAANSGLY